METVLFWFFAAVIAVTSLLTVTLPNLLHAAIAFMGSLLGIAGLFLLMHMEFVALMQVMVYVGGVVIFVVYTILLTTKLGERYDAPSVRKTLIAACLGLAATGVLLCFTRGEQYALAESAPDMLAIGTRLLSAERSGFLIPFEVISVLLLSALIGASTIAQRSARDDEEAKDAGSPPAGDDAP